MDKSSVLTTDLLKSRIYEGLYSYKDPYLPIDLGAAGCIKEIIINSRQVIVNLHIGFILTKHKNQLHKDLHSILDPIINHLAEEVGIELSLKINIDNEILIHAYQKQLERVPNIKNIIAIGSGKGGVGKSTVAVNIALALREQGAKVGVLDADLYGPSLPHMLGCLDKIKIINNKMQPYLVYGLHCISIGNLLEQEDAPVIWKGPMASGGLLELLHNTLWPELDYLIVDLPPGTGDIQLTLAQKVPITAAVVITTPQAIAVLDAQKALMMLKKLQIPILGLVENMSYLICADCNKRHDIFGSGGGDSMALKYGIRLLGNIPFEVNIRSQSDLGVPVVLALADSKISNIYHEIATKIAAGISTLPLDQKISNSQIVIE